MKRPRSASQLTTALDDDLAWRLQEIAVVRSSLKTAAGLRRTSLLRAAVPMLYAHWEGFIKGSAIQYTAYLSALNLKFGDVAICFSGVKAMSHVKSLGNLSKRIFTASETLVIINEIDKQNLSISLQDQISNIGNLNYDILEQILKFINIDTSTYSSKKALIDEALLKARNEIAHGQFVPIDYDRFESLTDEILSLMRQFKDDIQNATVLKTYLRVKGN